MNEKNDYLICRVEDKVDCNGQVEILQEKGIVIRHRSSVDTRLVFVTGIDKSVLCTGSIFQVHVWGDRKYTVWFLPSGVNYCAVMEQVYIDQCDENLYTVSREPHSCSKLKELSWCEKEILKTEAKRSSALFILLDIDVYSIDRLRNVIKHDDQDDCLAKFLTAQIMN